MNCFEIVQQTEAMLRYTHDVTLQTASAPFLRFGES